MTDLTNHSHVFLGEGHEKNERRTWMVIALCSFMMVAEIIGGLLFGPIALVADGLHMSTHASALLLAALAYSYARRYASDSRFTFGTGKLGDLAGFSSAIILAMIAVLIGYEAMTRFIWPVPISFNEAIPIAVLGLAVNIASVLLLSGGGHAAVTPTAIPMRLIATITTKLMNFKPVSVPRRLRYLRTACHHASDFRSRAQAISTLTM